MVQEIFSSFQLLADLLQPIILKFILMLLLESFYLITYLKLRLFLIKLLELIDFWMVQKALYIKDSQALLIYQSFNPPIKVYTLCGKCENIREF